MSQRNYGLQLNQEVTWRGEKFHIVKFDVTDNNKCYIKRIASSEEIIAVTCEEIA